VANKAYPDNLVSQNFNATTMHATTNTHGDGLANFIVRELCDTFEPSNSAEEQLKEACRVMSIAARELLKIEQRLKLCWVLNYTDVTLASGLIQRTENCVQRLHYIQQAKAEMKGVPNE
jgi:hypothetical protein